MNTPPDSDESGSWCKLKPCPFCGSAAKLRHSGPYTPEIAQTTRIECSNEDCRAEIARALPPEPVIAAWNKRLSHATAD